ncbi:MAG: antitoxin, partial [Chromatiaceae bacterium]|nr:antitoxin [Chromatiaceae bacterium]
MSATLSLETMLGGQRSLPSKPRTPFQWVSVIRQGIPSVALDSLTQAMRITQAELAAALAIPDRTLA